MSTEPLPDTWHARDLPVLSTFNRLVEQRPPGGLVLVSDIANELGLELREAERSCLALVDDGYIDDKVVDGGSFCSEVRGATGKGRRAVGQWPTAETGADRMLTALEQIAENGDTEDDRARARRALDALKGASGKVAISVAGAVISGGLT